ncbi:hypothetical protein TVAG_193500 [Trichomonas vaginalis G3]|uniref:Anaphase-promoting complex subunit 4 WD40 domain-containing protein n=1 Tax=Trichomonas vaginalis (strain ATCC PRA-98 / G3) TaxID=412133 RepID=A2DH64_TRIV3|nr:retinoblastoma-binding protein 5 family [Trichomonas vaginalis G3]EAY20374.1 hypothetical protein TVAG_193500 [Trichomonas vaginalis G3]KAI5530626.1 retinoblastoma-binding protein 5 family [Trichomonas vaginalis G3]|eukprot:XP_001581360.1 hypothetical protein [Trichomonas vaginalis G3]
MSFHTLLDDLYIDLPDWYNNTFHFNAKTTCMSISYHGAMLAVGLANGQTCLIDSFSGCGDHQFFKHKSAVVDCSFSRDGFLLAHCDNKNLTIHNIQTKQVVFEQNFDDKVLCIQFSRINPQLIYVLTSNANSLIRFNLSTRESMVFNGSFTIFNILPNDFIVAAKGSRITLIDTEKNAVAKVFDAPAKKNICSIEVSHKGELIIVLDKAGAAHLLNVNTGEFKHKFCDHVGDTRFATASFDRHDEHAIFGTSEIADASFAAYELDCYSLRKNFTNGPREVILQLIFHPVHPIVFARAMKGIHIWRAVYKNRWIHSVPELDNMFTNEMYQEPECEFDAEFESGVRNVEDLSGHPVDIFTKVPFSIFESDKNYPNQLITLPITIEDIKAGVDEEESEDEEDYDE